MFQKTMTFHCAASRFCASTAAASVAPTVSRSDDTFLRQQRRQQKSCHGVKNLDNGKCRN